MLMSHPRYFEIAVSQRDCSGDCEAKLSVCTYVRSVIENTLDAIGKRMNCRFKVDYAFECSTHPGRDHLATVSVHKSRKLRFMRCKSSVSNLEQKHTEWFEVSKEFVMTLVVLSGYIFVASPLGHKTFNEVLTADQMAGKGA